MMTALVPSKADGYYNAHDISAALPTFAHYLRLGEYRTCLSGKMHFTGPDQLHGYEERLTTDIYPSDFGWNPNWGEPDAKVTFQNMTNVLETGPCLRSSQIDYDDDVATKACKWLCDRPRAESTKPFMLTVSFTSPHEPYGARPKYWDLYTDDEIDLPAVPPIPVKDMDAHSKRIHGHYLFGKAEINDDVMRRARHGYYPSIEYIDAKVAAFPVNHFVDNLQFTIQSVSKTNIADQRETWRITSLENGETRGSLDRNQDGNKAGNRNRYSAQGHIGRCDRTWDKAE